MPASGVVAIGPDVVPRRDEIHPECVGPAQERTELDLAVASRARVRGEPARVLLDEVLDDGGLEVRGQIADLERESGDASDLGRVGARGRSATAVLDTVQVHERHV